jgi:hypothetical protein
MTRTLTQEQKDKMQEGRRRKAAEDAAQPAPAKDPQLGDAYVAKKALTRIIESGVVVGSTIEITRGKHKGERHVVKSMSVSEAEVFDGRRWWSCYITPPNFRVVT